MADLNEISMLELLPESIAGDSNVIAAAKAIDIELKNVLIAMENTDIIIPNIGNMPESVIDLLAWQYHVDFYDATLPLDTKRQLVLKSVDWHKRKGTPSVVREMVSSVLSHGVVTEWFQYGGQPGHFRVQTDEIITDQTVYDRLIKLVNAVKNVRSWLDNIIINRQWSGEAFFGVALNSGKTITIKPVQFNLGDCTGTANFGVALHIGKIISIH